MNKFYLFVIILCGHIFCSSCTTWKIKDTLKMNPQISKIVSVKRSGDNYKINLELTNGGNLIVLSASASAVIYIIEIGGYYGHTDLISNWNGKWGFIYHPNIPCHSLKYALHSDGYTLNEIIDSYDEIVAFLEKVYREPPIPHEGAKTLEEWGNDDELRRYSGYIMPHENRKMKLYVFYRQDENTKASTSN